MSGNGPKWLPADGPDQSGTICEDQDVEDAEPRFVLRVATDNQSRTFRLSLR